MIKGTVQQVPVVLISRVIFIHCRQSYDIHSESCAIQLNKYSSVGEAHL